MVVYTSLDVTLRQQMLQCQNSVRADTTYVVSFVAQVVTYNMAYVVEYFVLNFVDGYL